MTEFTADQLGFLAGFGAVGGLWAIIRLHELSRRVQALEERQ